SYVMGQLGMPMDEVLTLTVPSVFPRKNRPLLVCPEYIINYKSSDIEWLALVGAIDRIIARFPNMRGLIHTGNYRLATIIKERSKQTKRMITHDTADRQHKLDLFKSPLGAGLILVSPSMTEGVDLPYDMCDFQIIAKLPYPNQMDKLWQARINSDQQRGEDAYVS